MHPVNGWNAALWLLAVAVGFAVTVGYFAYRGQLWAWLVIAAVGTVTLIVIGWLMAMLQSVHHEKMRQRSFRDNADENLAVMEAQFKALSQMAQAQSRVANGVQRENIDLRRMLPSSTQEIERRQWDDDLLDSVFSDLS